MYQLLFAHLSFKMSIKYFAIFATILMVTSAKPTYLSGYDVPLATSYSNRYDIHHSAIPIVKAYEAPLVTKVVDPVYGYGAQYGAYGYDAYGYGNGYGNGYGSYGNGYGSYGYGHGW
ncbi:shematrin-like protein 2 [Sitophilus oryzae]|uniref:Shematrin-like protein 2 n=1 Tax=Sitophilus oryzae TaxID=7048 RepID=A0A6J2YR78_SITOR|nr:shematrin-like protein 2 [Sitophilus oryzae]